MRCKKRDRIVGPFPRLPFLSSPLFSSDGTRFLPTGDTKEERAAQEIRTDVGEAIRVGGNVKNVKKDMVDGE